MGVVVSKDSVDTVKVTVRVGDVLSSGTNNDVMIRFGDVNGKLSRKLTLNNTFHDDFKMGKTDHFTFSNLGDEKDGEFGEIEYLEIWRTYGILDDSLFLESLVVDQGGAKGKKIFPIHRWIPMGKDKKLFLSVYDSCLPQEDRFIEQRMKELAWKKQAYKTAPRAPVDLQLLDLGKKKIQTMVASAYKILTVRRPKSLDDFKKLYTSKVYPLPECAEKDWYLSDEYFGEQRLAACNPLQIELCTSIPDNFAVTDQMVAPFIEGKNLLEVIQERRLFLLDYVIIGHIMMTHSDRPNFAPLALLYRDSKDRLMPIAIQLQQTPSDENPVFLPSDPPYTWLMAKAWCNLADSSVHQAKAHLGFTHLYCESLCAATHMELSPSHPVFKLLAPHFLFLLSINALALDVLIAPGGYVDTSMYIGRLGVFEIIDRCTSTWRMDVDGNPQKDIEKRQVGKDVLPHYPYRDDALSLHAVIHDYVSDVVHGTYSSARKFEEDYEIQNWYKILSRPVGADGLGLKGIPGNGEVAKVEDIVEVVTATIFQASVQHAAVNFKQYEQYSFPIVYPSMLNGNPPTSKVPLTEADVLEALPDVAATMNIMSIVQLLSTRGTNSLGDFEIQYSYDPVAVSALEQFRKNLNDLQKEFSTRYPKRKYPYDILDPKFIPNAISI